MIPDTSGQDKVLASAPGASNRRRLAWIAAAAVIVIALVIAVPVMGFLVAFDFWHCRDRTVGRRA